MNRLDSVKLQYSDKQIITLSNLHEFMEAHVELLKLTIQMLYIVIELKYFEDDTEILLSRDEAVIGGNMVRSIKLNTSLLQNICERKVEICHIVERCLAETYINLKYMLIEGEEKVVRNYIKHSLITEKELLGVIESNIEERGGERLPIEVRMQESISRAFENSDFDTDEVSRSSKWKSFKQRLEQVLGNGRTFYTTYGLGSHSIHGNWQDIITHHLTKETDGFKLNLKWHLPQPQLTDAAIAFNLDLVNLFASKMLSDHADFSLIMDKSRSLFDYHEKLLNAHESWLNQKI